MIGVVGFYNAWKSEVAAREYGELERFDHRLRERDQEPPNKYVVDDCVVLRLSSKDELRDETRLGQEVSETWRDIIDFFEEARKNEIGLLNPSDMRYRARNGENYSSSEEFRQTFDRLKQVSEPLSVEKFKGGNWGLGPRDSAIAEAADSMDGVVITYDSDFLEADIPCNTPLGAYISMLE